MRPAFLLCRFSVGKLINALLHVKNGMNALESAIKLTD
jgi:hypothetical protein|tara:strand:+ start:106 stop:219 length:114 start_codon:yes stop_codon:yes gene_type:complete